MAAFFANLLPSSMFTQSFMLNAFASGTIVAVVAGLVGFFALLRRSTYAAHALPQIGFAGAAGAVLLTINPIVGLSVFTIGGALSIGWLGKRGRRDVSTAIILVVALGTGSLFLVLNNNYATNAYAQLFGQLIGVSLTEVRDTAILGLAVITALVTLYRPLLFASIMKDHAAARGVPVRLLELSFLVIIGLATAITVPVVGALLSFSLMIGPAAAARQLTHRPSYALSLAIVIAVVTLWLALILAYDSGWPVGFFVSTISAITYGASRLWSQRG